jgi:hypothetical protein
MAHCEDNCPNNAVVMAVVSTYNKQPIDKRVSIMHERLKQYDFKRRPLRGIFREIAKENGVSRQAIRKAAQAGNPVIIKRILMLIRIRQSAWLSQWSE